MLAAPRDDGVDHLEEIAACEAAALGIGVELASEYLRDNLYFKLGDQERDALLRFYRLCAERGLAPPDRETTLMSNVDGCVAREPRIAR